VAGFRNVIIPLGIYSGAVAAADGGFATVVPPLRIAAAGTTLPAQGGFGTPLGVLLVRSSVRYQAGYFSIIAPLPLGATASEPVADEPGSAWNWRDPGEREWQDGYRKIILQEDEELLELLMSFLHVMGDE
jgi:hypothetical protein